MSKRERCVMICLCNMLTVIENYQERHKRLPITRFLRWLYGY